jgi:hypothetical protein
MRKKEAWVINSASFFLTPPEILERVKVFAGR